LIGANALTEKGREGFLDGTIDFDDDDIAMALLDPTISDTACKPVTGATNASPIVITATSHGFTNGDIVIVGGVGGNTAANGKWTIGSADTHTFALVGSSGNGAYTTGGWVVNMTLGDNLDDFDAAQIDSEVFLANKSVTFGVANCNPVVFGAVPGGDTARALLVFQATGTPSSSRTIAVYGNVTGFPMATNGGDITIAIDSGANKLFKL
jgi:hypothetical protein